MGYQSGLAETTSSFLGITDILIIAGLVLIGFVTIGLILARSYRRASKEVSFVRTGFSGQKVILNGGALVLPVLHETIPVNMNTLRLEVRRANEAALITRDRMRVDVTAEFYVRVKPTADSIANAAQTLGQRTMHPEALKDLVEGKFVDALRAVAAEMAMEELHEQRVDFVQKVQTAVSEDLLKNGLELETVSLTGLDQTNRENFNPDNAFDAAGLTKLTDEIEDRRKRRNEIEKVTEVEVQRQNLTAERQKLEIERETEYARLEQQREIQIRQAEQSAEIAAEQARRTQESENAQITAEQDVQVSRIRAERTLEEERIERERVLKEREIEKAKSVDLANQESAIAIANKSKAQSEAHAQAEYARSEAVKAEEVVLTVRETQQAERQKEVDLVRARQAAEREAIGITMAAEAKKQAAEDEAEALRTIATAEAEKSRIAAEGEAEAEKLRASAAEARYEVEANGQRALNEADNSLTPEIVAMRIKLAIVQNLDQIIRESVKPMENIDGIKIIQLDGLNGNGAAHGDGAPSNGQGSGLADQVVASALRYRSQAPLIDSLMKEVGLDGSNLDGLVKALSDGENTLPDASAQPTELPKPAPKAPTPPGNPPQTNGA